MNYTVGCHDVNFNDVSLSFEDKIIFGRPLHIQNVTFNVMGGGITDDCGGAHSVSSDVVLNDAWKLNELANQETIKSPVGLTWGACISFKDLLLLDFVQFGEGGVSWCENCVMAVQFHVLLDVGFFKYY